MLTIIPLGHALLWRGQAAQTTARGPAVAAAEVTPPAPMRPHPSVLPYAVLAIRSIAAHAYCALAMP